MAAVSVTGGIGNVTGQLSVLGFTGYLAFLQIVPIGAITATGNLASTIFNTLGNISSYLSKIQGTFPLFDAFAYEKPAHEISLPSKKKTMQKILCWHKLLIVIKRPMENRNECCSISQPLLKLDKSMPSWGKRLRQVNIIQFVDWTAQKTIADRSAWEKRK